jgi:MFS family permease
MVSRLVSVRGLPIIQVDYGLDATRIAQLQTLYTVVAALGCLLGGFIADRFGIKRTVAAAFALTALVTFGLASQISLVGLTGVSAVFFVGRRYAHISIAFPVNSGGVVGADGGPRAALRTCHRGRSGNMSVTHVVRTPCTGTARLRVGAAERLLRRG